MAKVLNAYDVSYAIGASALLYLKGISDHFNDLDIVFEVKDLDKLKLAFIELDAKSYPLSNNDSFKSEVFLQYQLDGVDIDVIGGFRIINDDIIYDCPFNGIIDEYVCINEVKIPLDSLTAWEKYYHLMKREAKANMIHEYLKSRKF